MAVSNQEELFRELMASKVEPTSEAFAQAAGEEFDQSAGEALARQPVKSLPKVSRKALARAAKKAFDQGFDECIRLRAIRQAIKVADAMTVKVTDDWKEKEKILRVLKGEESAVQDWLHYKRELPSEYNPDLPLDLRTKIPQSTQKSPEEFTAELKSSGADDIEIAGQLKRFYPDLLPSRIGRLVTHDPSINVVSDAYRKRGCRLLEKYEKRKKNTL
jgi:hypothetical protein